MIRYLDGGSPYNLISSHPVCHNDVYNIIRSIVDAINQCSKNIFSLSTGYDKQKEVTSHFTTNSSIGFDNCASCIDGLLIRTSKPTMSIIDEANLMQTQYSVVEKLFWPQYVGYI